MTAAATDRLSNRPGALRPTGRARTACMLLGCALVVSSVAARGARAQAPVAGDSVPLQGLNLSDEDLPFDATGRPIVEGLPGVLPIRQVPQAARDDLLPLLEERDRVLDAARNVRGAITIAPLPSDVNAPASVDSGAPDPDRLTPNSQPTLPTL